MGITSLQNSLGLTQGIVSGRRELIELQRQLATGKRAVTYGGLGSDRSMVLSMRGELSAISGYQKTIEFSQIRLTFMMTHLDRMNELLGEARANSFDSSFEQSTSGRLNWQSQMESRFGEMVDLLNSEVAGRHNFGGRRTDQPPVVNAKEIMDGQGARAGLRQVIAERQLADLGADGRGRLVVSAPAANTVSIAEDVAGSVFGFKLSNVSSQLSGTATAGPAGAPAEITVAFSATLPVDGETIRLTFDMPDGTSEDLELTARAANPAGEGDFLIGADAAATATNFNAAVAQLIEDRANTALAAASASAASGDFFESDPPLRVSGPPFETATAKVAGTSANTVFWYQGDPDTGPARNGALAKVDQTLVVPYGARANEEAFRWALRHLGAMAAQNYVPGDDISAKRLDETRARGGQALGYPPGIQTVDNIVAELSSAQKTLVGVKDRHLSTHSMLQGAVDDIEGVDVYEVSAKVLALQTRLQASYETTSILARLSLVNFMG